MNKNGCLLPAIALCLAPAMLNASPLHKCVQPDGSVVYQDRACSGDGQAGKVNVNPPPREEDRLRAQQRLHELEMRQQREALERELARQQQAQDRPRSDRGACVAAIEIDYDADQYALKDYASRLCAAGLDRRAMRKCMDEFEINTPGRRLTRAGAEMHINTCIRMHGR